MKTLRPYPRATITPKGEHALEKGHPWVYEAEVVSLEPAPGEAAVANGSIVDVVSRKGSYLGSGLLSEKSKIHPQCERSLRPCLLEAEGAVGVELPENGDGRRCKRMPRSVLRS